MEATKPAAANVLQQALAMNVPADSTRAQRVPSPRERRRVRFKPQLSKPAKPKNIPVRRVILTES
jgi:hypothetical protein